MLLLWKKVINLKTFMSRIIVLGRRDVTLMALEDQARLRAASVLPVHNDFRIEFDCLRNFGAKPSSLRHLKINFVKV